MDDSTGKRAGRKRWLFRAILVLLILSTSLVGGLMIFEWRPKQLMDTPVKGEAETLGKAPETLSLLSWNIGYAGLGRDADFFMDGGKMVRPRKLEVVQANLRAIQDHLEENPADVVLLQEVDTDASRTFGINQAAVLARALPDHFYTRAVNFKVPWIPYPLLSPLGRVESGLVTFSRYPITRAVRHQLPGSYAWPVRVFHLKRCLHEVRFPAPDGRDWVILHLHLSAFDSGGHLRKQQMAYLRELILGLQREGQHVIAGGDWNQAFPGIGERHYPHRSEIPDWFQKAPADWTPPGWKWVFDDRVPSLRATNKPYVPGENFVTTVDGFLVSPEIKILESQTVDLGFAHSDHHPVRARLSLMTPD